MSQTDKYYSMTALCGKNDHNICLSCRWCWRCNWTVNDVMSWLTVSLTERCQELQQAQMTSLKGMTTNRFCLLLLINT